MAGTDGDASFEALLEHLETDRGFDFTGHKRSTLLRRMRKRAEEVGTGGFDEYRESWRPAGRVRHPLQYQPHQRHRLLPRPRRAKALAHDLRARLDE